MAPQEVSKTIARRGAQWLTGAELEEHLATLLRVEHAAVFLGSGASVGALGGQTISQAWEGFKTESKSSYDWLLDEGFVGTGITPNIEDLVDAVEICRIERFRSQHPALIAVTAAQADLRRALVRAGILNSAWWQGSLQMQHIVQLRSHRTLLLKVCGARQPGQPSPWVFTSNFDLAIEWAAESLGLNYINGFSGLHTRRFSPHNFDLGFRNVLARGEARFGTYNFYLAKLHGSLSWLDAGVGEVIEKPSTALWLEIKAFLDGSTDGLKNILALPGAAKYVTTVGFVMGELFRRFTDFLAHPQTMLLVNGYSCSDEHLNRILVTALQNPTLQMVVYARSATCTGDALTVPAERKWIQDLAVLELPQVTIVFGEDASFQAMVSQLPDPAIYDEQAAHIRKLLRPDDFSAS